MNVSAIISTIEQVIKVATQAVQAGMEIEPYAKAIYDHLVKGKTVSESDLEALETKIDALSDELQQALRDEPE